MKDKYLNTYISRVEALIRQQEEQQQQIYDSPKKKKRKYKKNLLLDMENEAPRNLVLGMDYGDDQGLVFNSKFECGNLNIVFKTEVDYEYDLLLQNDVNTDKNTQWFYFKVANTKKGKIAKFNILNFVISFISLINHSFILSIKITLCITRE